MLRNLRLALSILFAVLLSWGTAQALTDIKLQPETLQYKVMYKWGFIHKKAGTATLTLRHTPNEYVAQLSASSEPWADKFFRVRDTLNGRMTRADFTPLYYEKIAHEGSEYKHDRVIYDYTSRPVVAADCYRKVYKKGQLKVDEQRRLESEGAAVDMLTSFYFMRTLPFESWTPGHVEKIDIFSGKRKELLSIVYGGVVDVDLDGSTARAYHITFQFTSGGGKKTSDDMEAWIAADNSRIPLRLEGKLPVGKVHCILTSSTVTH